MVQADKLLAWKSKIAKKASALDRNHLLSLDYFATAELSAATPSPGENIFSFQKGQMCVSIHKQLGKFSA